MKIIVAVDLNWGIGYKGGLLQRIPEDMRFFKQMTSDKVVVMGNETFNSLPGREPLKNRTNIVLSNNESFYHEKVIICRSLTALGDELKKYRSEDIFVIGGESVYTQLLPYCAEAYITKINKIYQADKYFTDLDRDENWQLISAGNSLNHNDIQFAFCKYVNNRVKPI